jgi:O-antigen/teichoic acid export membrane protein
VSIIARGTLVNLATRLAAIALGVSITVVVARIGTAAQGQFALFTSVESLLLALFSGFGVALARRVSHHGARPAQIVGATIWACVALGGASALVMIGLSMAARGTYALLWILALSAPVLLLPANLSGIWLGQGRMGPLGLVTMTGPALTLLFFAAFWLFDAAQATSDVLAMLLAWVLAKTVLGIVVLGRFWSVAAQARPDWSSLRQDGAFVAIIGATNLVGILNYRADLFLVEHFLGAAPTGVYSIAVMLAELLWLLSSAVTQAAYARIGTPERDRAARFVVRIVHANLAVLALVAPLLYLAARFVLPLLLGPGYEDAPLLLAVVLPGVLSYGAASPLSAYFTNHAGRPHVPALVAGLSLLINLAICVVLIPRLGAIGAAWATTVSYVISVSVMLWLFARHSGVGWRGLARPDLHDLRQQASSLLALLRWRRT